MSRVGYLSTCLNLTSRIDWQVQVTWSSAAADTGGLVSLSTGANKARDVKTDCLYNFTVYKVSLCHSGPGDSFCAFQRSSLASGVSPRRSSVWTFVCKESELTENTEMIRQCSVSHNNRGNVSTFADD